MEVSPVVEYSLPEDFIVGWLGGIVSMVGINPTAMTIWESRE